VVVPTTSLPLQSLAGVPARVRALVRAGDAWTGRGRLPATAFDPHDALMLVGHGLLSVSTVMSSGRVITVSLLAPGDVWCGDVSASLRADALCPSSVALVERDALAAVLATDAAAASWLADRHLLRAIASERRLAAAVAQSVEDRLREALAEVARARSTRLADGSVRLGLRISQERLAWLAGTTRESANRAMRSLMAGGAVSRTAGRYVLAPGFSPGEGPS
jgi:CRP/FNR family transcriptional regulator, cyclic AMP receptor protein